MRLIASILMIVTCTMSFAQQQITACYAEWYPYSYQENGQASGFSIEIYKAVAKRSNLDIVFIHKPWERCKIDVTRGDVDALVDGGLSVSNTLNAKRRPVPWVMVMWVKEKSLYQTFEGYSQFDGKIIMYVRGYAYPDEFVQYKGFEKLDTTTDIQGLKVLESRSVDAFFGDIVSSTSLVEKHSLKVRPLSPAIKIRMLTLSFHQTLYKEHKRFETALEEMYQDGSIDAIYQKYLGVSYQTFMNKYSHVFE